MIFQIIHILACYNLPYLVDFEFIASMLAFQNPEKFGGRLSRMVHGITARVLHSTLTSASTGQVENSITSLMATRTKPRQTLNNSQYAQTSSGLGSERALKVHGGAVRPGVKLCFGCVYSGRYGGKSKW